MKYIIDFEDDAFINSNGTKLYRIKGSTSVCVPSSYLYHFPKYKEDPTANDERMKELKTLQPGDIIIRQNEYINGGIERELVLYRYNYDQTTYQVISQSTGVIADRTADRLYIDGWQKYWDSYETKDFFYSLREEKRDDK